MDVQALVVHVLHSLNVVEKGEGEGGVGTDNCHEAN